MVPVVQLVKPLFGILLLCLCQGDFRPQVWFLLLPLRLLLLQWSLRCRQAAAELFIFIFKPLENKNSVWESPFIIISTTHLPYGYMAPGCYWHNSMDTWHLGVTDTIPWIHGTWVLLTQFHGYMAPGCYWHNSMDTWHLGVTDTIPWIHGTWVLLMISWICSIAPGCYWWFHGYVA